MTITAPSLIHSDDLCLAEIVSGQESLPYAQFLAILQAMSWPFGRSLDSAHLCAHVETSSSRSVPCASNSAFSLVPIDGLVHLTVCSGCACDVGGLARGTRWCWSGQPRLPRGSAKGSVDAGAVARGGNREERSLGRIT